ncbi:glycosyltransferase family 4 protein [Tahibacter amnicola]|uniref:Glycosyltransferase family 4 protein n=1 Tax=Tahibacter amnicola TaxID=2976241 RepID=A0ABY6B934_9GAMM|nr:glycosyltransferase family 4 protein [Tahibacter amnicola]UXI66390.1 glycosyltransferase family 4 protein [Tahibacter amnicola]
MTRLLYLSSVMVPPQVKLCVALRRRHVDAQFWFYEGPERTRGTFWRIDGGDSCRILPDTWLLNGRYLSLELTRQLDTFDPDIVILGGFSIPGNYLAYRWARRNGKRVVVFTERSRDRHGNLRGASPAWWLLRNLYRHVDLVIVSADDAVAQFRDVLGFGQKVVAGRYAADIDGYLGHPARKPGDSPVLLYPNRMTPIYAPLLALDIFAVLRRRYPNARLLMNAAGELGPACRRRVAELTLETAVEFLADIRQWNELPDVYARAHVMILPATFSNGNFTIIESMASGLGIVISDRILGIGNLIEEGVNGFRCEPTVEAFVDRIERYLRSPALIAQHAHLNRAIARPLGAEGTAEFLLDLLARNGQLSAVDARSAA